MGKNQAHKAVQRSRVGSDSAAPGEIEDGMVDGSFHSPEWHAARLANLKTSHTVTWEEFKRKQKEDELKKGELEADKDKMMREYRAQLDAERARKLAQGRNHSSNRKDRDLKKRPSNKRKHSRRRYTDSTPSSSSSDSSSSDDEERESRRRKSRSKRSKKEKKHRSRRKHSSGDDKEIEGPVPLSKFFGSAKS